MKNFYKLSKLFTMGFLGAILIMLLTHCPKENPINPDDTKPLTETSELATISDSFINALNEKSVSKVEVMMPDDLEEFYITMLKENTDKMPAFAEALKNRKLIFLSEMYAEYQIEIDGQKYTLAYGNSDNLGWKLIKF